LHPDKLVIRARSFNAQGVLAAAATGAALLWRVKADLRLPVLELLPDSSYLSLVARPTLHDKARNKLIAAARAGGHLDPAQAMRVLPPEQQQRSLTAVMADITSLRNLNPPPPPKLSPGDQTRPPQLLPGQTARRHRHLLPRAAHDQARQPPTAAHHDQLRLKGLRENNS
jgi:hypothetical protein